MRTEKEKGFLLGLFSWEKLKMDRSEETKLINKLERIDEALAIEFEELLEETKEKYYKMGVEGANHITNANFETTEENLKIDFTNF